MKKIILIILVVGVVVSVLVVLAGMYKFNYLASQPGYDVDGNKIEKTEDLPASIMHPSWDVDGDGLNDCENDGTCDHTIDYTQAKE